jgi:RNA polymerase sigma factor (sigma-70 family)
VVGRPHAEEDRLVEAARRGDAAAFTMLLRSHQQIALRTAWVITGGSAEAEDAVQEAFIRAWRAMPRFRAGAPFRPWLMTIVANEARTRGRCAARRARLQLREAAERTVSGGAAPSPETAVLTADATSALAAAIDRMSRQDREVILCRHVLELSERETAAVLGCPPGTIKSRLSRALSRLRVMLEDER